MKNKFARIGKKAMSLALAFAVVAVSMFTVIAVNVSAETQAVTELTWDGTYTKPTEKDGETVIIKTAAEFAWVALKGGNATAGKTYKVADGIKSIYVNDVKDLTLAQVRDNLNNKGTNVWKYQDAVFQGTLDGNGATVYGLYSTGTSSGNSGGLIPCASGTVTVKNIRVSTSYIGGQVVSGGLIGRLPTASATISFDNCAVVNSYLFTTTTSHGWHNGAAGLCGGGEKPTLFTVNNCLVANNEFYSTCGEQNSAFVGQFNINSTVTFKISNSIALGVIPVPGNGTSYWTTTNNRYENVYTDFDVSKAAWNDKPFAETSVKQITLDQIKGDAAKTNTKLDFAKTWWIVKDSTPVLRVFHNIKATSEGEKGHTEKCTDDGCKLIGAATVPHTFGDDHICTACKYECKHTGAKWVKLTDGDCVTAPTGKYVCDCGYESTEGSDMTFKAGHKFGDVVPENTVTCVSDGTVAYKHCSVCDKDFAENASDTEPMANALETVVSESAKGHKFGKNVDANAATCTEDGNVAYKHCSECEKDFDVNADVKSTDYLETTVISAKGHTFGEDIKATDATCTEDATVAYKHCSVCDKDFDLKADEKSTDYLETIVEKGTATGHQKVEFVEEVPATTTTEGTKAHYICKDCETLFEDEEATKEVKAEDLVIEKLPVNEWVQDSTGWWYKNDSAKGYATGWATIGGSWYYFDESGYMQTGWQSIDGTWYYFYDSGVMATSTWIGNDYVTASGAMGYSTWQLDGNGWWYQYADGSYATGWQVIGGSWYYFNASGYAVTGWQVIGGTWYYFNAGGDMVTGWASIGGTWYYFNAGGDMATGWALIGGSWYYFYADGSMASNCYVGGYWLTAGGAMA